LTGVIVATRWAGFALRAHEENGGQG
jgi:hypothetical protein